MGHQVKHLQHGQLRRRYPDGKVLLREFGESLPKSSGKEVRPRHDKFDAETIPLEPSRQGETPRTIQKDPRLLRRQVVGIAFPLKGRFPPCMYRKSQLRLKRKKSARPVHLVPGAYVGAPAKRLQPAAVLVFYDQIPTEAGSNQVGSGTGGAHHPLIYEAVYFCPIFSTHGRHKAIFPNRCQEEV